MLSSIFIMAVSLSVKVSRKISIAAFLKKGMLFETAPVSITKFYKTDYSEYYDKNRNLIDSSVASVQKAFNQNTFPAMKVTYDHYPEHIGHLESDGCFRCHNGSFKSEDGKTITRDCNQCHTILGQGTPDSMQYTSIRENLEFRHPVDIGTAW